MMKLNEFIERIEHEVKERLGNGYSVETHNVPKNNGISYEGLCIRKDENAAVPTIHLEPFYDMYRLGACNDESICDIVNQILILYHDNETLPACVGNTGVLTDYEQVKPRIMYKLINTKANRELLEQVPNMPYLDLSIVFYLFLDEDGDGQYTALIHNSHKDIWGVSTDALYQQARENTQRDFPASIRSMNQVIQELSGCLDIEWEEEEGMKPPFYILSNRCGINGAGALLYEHVLAEFAEMEHSNIIILPSSLHEVLLLPADDDMDFQALHELVSNINLTEVPDEDRLSDHVYLYNYDTKKLCIAA